MREAITVNRWLETDLAYFAGLLDGEGCFSLRNQGTHIFSCQVNIGNTDLRLLEWVKDRFGGSINAEARKNPKHKPVWRWCSDATTLADMLPAIIPHLIAKRDRAELMLVYRRTLAPPITGHRRKAVLSDGVKQERSVIHSRLAVLNQRGIA